MSESVDGGRTITHLLLDAQATADIIAAPDAKERIVVVSYHFANLDPADATLIYRFEKAAAKLSGDMALTNAGGPHDVRGTPESPAFTVPKGEKLRFVANVAKCSGWLRYFLESYG